MEAAKPRRSLAETKSDSDIRKVIKNLDVSLISPNKTKDTGKGKDVDKDKGAGKGNVEEKAKETQAFHRIPTINPTRSSHGDARRCAFCGKQFSFEYSLQTHEKFLCKSKFAA